MEPEDEQLLRGAPRAQSHPYRIMDATEPVAVSASGEDVLVWSAVGFVGALGVVNGVAVPERTAEASLGVLMLLFVAVTVASERRHRRAAHRAVRARNAHEHALRPWVPRAARARTTHRSPSMSQSRSRWTRRAASLALVAVLTWANATPAIAQEESPPTKTPVAPTSTPSALPATSPPAVAAVAPKEEKPALEVTPVGYVEAHYAYNFNRPSNGITNFRGFDNRHNTFTLANAALGANWEVGPVGGRLVLQVGSTPSTYYLGEPSLVGAGGANASSAGLWQYLQEAFVTYKAPVGRGLLLQLGLCASPIGYETFAIKDNWNWSRSNLFFGLPFYHTGLRATYEWTDALSTTLSVFNGWNSVVDSNEGKSVQANVTYKIPDKVLVQALYFGGIERASGAVEGPYWRHHFDVLAQVDATRWLSFAGQGDYGWEPNRIGTARWVAGALYARVKPIDRVYFTVRGDRFHEHLATDAGGRASSPIFWGGVEWVSSGTATLDVRPHPQLSIRLEFRHDAAEAPLYFGRDVQGDGTPQAPYVANARTQDTLVLGATAWF